MEPYVTHYEIMPIPPVEAQTRYFEAGRISIGVEYRLLNDAIAARHVEDDAPDMEGVTGLEDCGVSLHVLNETRSSRTPGASAPVNRNAESPRIAACAFTCEQMKWSQLNMAFIVSIGKSAPILPSTYNVGSK